MACFHVWCGFDGRYCGQCTPPPRVVMHTIRDAFAAIERKALAALNAPTGAVEKECGA